MKNHALKDQVAAKKKTNKETLIAQKRSANMNDRQIGRKSVTKNESFVDNMNHEKIQSNHVLNNFNDIKPKTEESNTIDLVDISKCIMGIEDEKFFYNDFESTYSSQPIKTERSSDEYVSIEAIKKYLNEASIEFSDLNSLDQTNGYCYNNL